MFKAKVILDSLNEFNKKRLTTFELTYPRFIHSEFMTHRHFSRNAASSRAIPTNKLLSMIKNSPAMPVSWGANQKGMAADKQVDDIKKASDEWLEARDSAVLHAEKMQELSLHKQVLNRILEPFVWMTVICSATEYGNFFALRDHPDAQPEIQLLARMMKASYFESIPTIRDWHIPYIQEDEEHIDIEIKKKMGVARCARVSYLTHDGAKDINKDLELYDRLLSGSGHGHWSPFEHVAMATKLNHSYYNFSNNSFENQPIWCGNFQGWIQFRKTCVGECQ